MDARDREILILLQGNGRATKHSLAQCVGLSAPAAASRMQRLERDGLVRGYRADVAPEAFGIGLQAIVVVYLTQHSQARIEGFERAVIDLPSVVSCYHTTGPFDYFLHLAARDAEHLGQLLGSDLATVRDFARLETLLVLSEVKADAGWPVIDDIG